MNDDRIKGKVDDIKGRVKRQVGEWTGDAQAQDEGIMDQAKGKTQNAWGKVKDSAKDLKDEITGPDVDRKRDVA
jgi:uncharacterized protein YjbJ (UPF0337 family)